MILTQCAACAKPLAHDAPRCVRCWTRYCDASCQLEHWNNGHKKKCKKIARGGGAEQFYADAKAKEALDAAVVACRPHIPADAICYICRNDASAQGLVSGCGCHGGDGIAHVTCLARMAQMATEEYEETGVGHGFTEWQHCYICDQPYHSSLQVAVAWACWKTYVGDPDNWRQLYAMGALGAALTDNGSSEAALRIVEARLAGIRRIAPHDKEWISVAQQNVANCLSDLKRYAEALSLYRAVYSDKVARYGKSHARTILTGNNLADTLQASGFFEEAQQIARKQLVEARRALGERHAFTITAATILAQILYCNPASVRADVIEAEALFSAVSNTAKQVLGPQHPRVLQIEGMRKCAREILSELEP